MKLVMKSIIKQVEKAADDSLKNEVISSGLAVLKIPNGQKLLIKELLKQNFIFGTLWASDLMIKNLTK